ncbi:cortexin domain-containing 1 protein isoform X1 [Pezoporus occidentalis]|uniref:cortexin domain-containing 1 protein isoform X1 n=1 Tax=Pezoporus occidentalis TaxID=407982 RepID=UPI002F90BE5C
MDRVSSRCSQKTSVQSTGNYPPHAETLELNCAERRTLQLREPCVPGKSSHVHSAEKQCKHTGEKNCFQVWVDMNLSGAWTPLKPH